MHCWVTQIYSFTCTVIYISVRNRGLISIHLSINLWCYSPFWGLASLSRHLHSSLSSAHLLHPHIASMGDMSLWTTASHLDHGFSTGIVLWSCIWNFPLRTSFWDLFIFHSHSTTHPSYNSHNIYIFVQIINYLVFGHKFFLIFPFKHT